MHKCQPVNSEGVGCWVEISPDYSEWRHVSVTKEPTGFYVTEAEWDATTKQIGKIISVDGPYYVKPI